jgi:transcriptional regulator with GAF, ATPase, and Fis domain/pSer/pThr/pTyr-binding forkhead associated (FHA) protein
MQPRLVALSGALSGTIRHLVDDSISIGRDESNGLCLPERAVSRHHCRIEAWNGGHQVVDLDSFNGTFVNGIPAKRRSVQHGDTLRVGASEFVFLVHEGEPRPAEDDKPAAEHSVTTIKLGERPAVPNFGMEVGRMARDLIALFKVSNVINSIRDARMLQLEFLRLVFEVIPAECGAVVLSGQPEGGDEPAVCTWSRKHGADQPIDVDPELMHRAQWERAAIITSTATTETGMANVLCVPLVAVERTLGVIYLAANAEAPAFREDHAYFLDSVARIAAVTLENILALDALRSENERLTHELNPTIQVIGESRAMQRVTKFIQRVAGSDSNVLICGESGTGKEVVARSLHQNSPRQNRPFVAINCAAIPETLLESELFGHEKGAFTGAVVQRKGKLEAAEDGTIFLDEIGELPMSMQAKLLRVLQEREFERVGGTRTLPLKARILAATNRELEQSIKAGEFRQDLYYRLNVVSITVPPLRDHREDISLLALHFATKFSQRSKRPFKGISREARKLLMAYDWPGNVRELENAMEHAIVLGQTAEILPEDLPENILELPVPEETGSRYHEALNKTKRDLVLSSLHEAKYNYPQAAKLLGIHQKYLHRLVKNLGIDRAASG